MKYKYLKELPVSPMIQKLKLILVLLNLIPTNMKWYLFLYYCIYCKTHDLDAKSYADFFDDRELVALISLDYFRFLLKTN